MSIIHLASGYPISVKGVVLNEGRVLLLLNERDEWDLPGGRPDAGETYSETVVREVLEESGARVRAEQQIDEWAFEVLPGRFVWIVAVGCRPTDIAALRISEEHSTLAWHAIEALDSINIPAGYARAVRLWARNIGAIR